MIAVYARRSARRLFGNILARALGARVFTPETVFNNPHVQLVNWGCSTPPNNRVPYTNLGNTPEATGAMSHKRRMFQAFTRANVPCLDWTTNIQEAREWRAQGHHVYARLVMQGHSGEGIRRIAPNDAIAMPDAPLYTKGITGKFREYRVHFFGGRIIATQIKRRMSAEKMQEMGIEPPEDEVRSAIRTYRNGWVFCVNNVNLSQDAQDVCHQAMRSLNATAGAVDILVKNGDTIVIETNSAPALRSPTVRAAYVDAIRAEARAHGG